MNLCEPAGICFSLTPIVTHRSALIRIVCDTHSCPASAMVAGIFPSFLTAPVNNSRNVHASICKGAGKDVSASWKPQPHVAQSWSASILLCQLLPDMRCIHHRCAREHRQQNNHALHATPERSERCSVKGIRDSAYTPPVQRHPCCTFSMLAGS